jgi:hypothetical protein
VKGRKPKSPETRQRRNKSTSAATLPPEKPEGEAAQPKVPPLPEKNGGWTKQAMVAWYRIWKAPMAARYLKADFFRIEILTDMVDRYWRGETALASQIRLEGDSFATSPLARRRLEWEIRDQAEELEKVAAAGGARQVTKRGGPDPRKVLRGEFAK